MSEEKQPIQLISEGFPVMVSGDRIIIEEVENNHLTEQGLLIVDVGGRDNSARVAKIVAISPELFNKTRHPDFFYGVGDMVYFNHLNGNYMRLRVPGRKEMGRFFCLNIYDILGKFIEPETYFAQAVKEMEGIRTINNKQIEETDSSDELFLDIPRDVEID